MNNYNFIAFKKSLMSSETKTRLLESKEYVRSILSGNLFFIIASNAHYSSLS